MKEIISSGTIAIVLAVLTSAFVKAQEPKPVPKDSVRVFTPGCSKGYMFTAGRPTEDQPGGAPIPEGTHLRMNGPKKLMAEIKGQEGSRIEITGLIRKGQTAQDGIGLGGGVRVTGAGSPNGGTVMGRIGTSPIMIDVEGWRRVPGDCPRR